MFATKRIATMITARSTINRLQQAAGYASKKTVKENPNAVELHEAIRILKAVEVGRPQHQLEMHVQCKIEKSTPPIRGSISLPRGIKQEASILVFAEGKMAEEARTAGAAYVGGQELIDQVKNGDLKFDKCISTPDMLPAVAKIARVLGPKGLMPTLKKGTVTEDIFSTVQKSKGSFDFKGDKNGVLHTGFARVSFTPEEIEANMRAILEEVKTFGKAHNLRGIIRNVVLSSTRGPGIHISGSQQL
ncbi:ribosomal protein L1-like protein [Umbelopsis sp. PMI_123]|nr:ribosomal protein L1-like protein [Umbelopsis sp. PMI_123]